MDRGRLQQQFAVWHLLVFDGHISHVYKAFLHRCLDYQVPPVCLPPCATHFLQPLDVSVLGPLKYAYSDLLQVQYAQGERGVWKGNLKKASANEDEMGDDEGSDVTTAL